MKNNNTVESRLFEPSIFRNSRFFEQKIVFLGFASVRFLSHVLELPIFLTKFSFPGRFEKSLFLCMHSFARMWLVEHNLRLHDILEKKASPLGSAYRCCWRYPLSRAKNTLCGGKTVEQRVRRHVSLKFNPAEI